MRIWSCLIKNKLTTKIFVRKYSHSLKGYLFCYFGNISLVMGKFDSIVLYWSVAFILKQTKVKRVRLFTSLAVWSCYITALQNQIAYRLSNLFPFLLYLRINLPQINNESFLCKKKPHFKKIVFSSADQFGVTLCRRLHKSSVQYNLYKMYLFHTQVFTWSIDDCGALKNHMIFKFNSCFYFYFHFIKISTLSVLP